MQAGVSDAGVDSRRLFSFLTGMSDTDIVVRGREERPEQAAGYIDLIERRASGIPLQYITHEQEFMGLSFYVDERVLIPRMDTEILVEEALKQIDRTLIHRAKPLDVLDLCCGSGAIGIAVAVLAKDNVKVTCSDISGDALEVAKINAEKNGADIEFVQGDMLEPFMRTREFGMILCNPPYIRSGVIPTLMKEVRAHEPYNALDGGRDGLEFYRRLAKDAPETLKHGCAVLMEIGCDQKDDVARIFKEDGRYFDAECIKDLAGLDRVMVVQYRWPER